MYNMKSNFYPAKDPKNGYVGIADLTVANAVRIRGIAIFENKEGDGHHIQFPGYGEGEHTSSYVIPSSKEAYAAMLNVVEKAIADQEKHFAWTPGKMNPYLTVEGYAVTEPYADGRFSIEIPDLCTLRGISTREVDYEREGKTGSFISVDMPTLPPYEKDGHKVYPAVFEGLKDTYERDGEKRTKDYGLLMRNIVRDERKNILEQRPSLQEQVSNAEQKTSMAIMDKGSPVPEPAR